MNKWLLIPDECFTVARLRRPAIRAKRTEAVLEVCWRQRSEIQFKQMWDEIYPREGSERAEMFEVILMYQLWGVYEYMSELGIFMRLDRQNCAVMHESHSIANKMHGMVKGPLKLVKGLKSASPYAWLPWIIYTCSQRETKPFITVIGNRPFVIF